MVKKTDSNHSLFEESKYIIVRKEWDSYYIFQWEDGMRYLSAIGSALIMKGSPDLDEEGEVKLSTASGGTLAVIPLSEEHLQALRMKSLVTKDT